MGIVYLLHFSKPFRHARHYIGFTDRYDLQERINEHRRGTGATLMKHVMAAGIDFEVSQVWVDTTRTFERSLKNKKHTSRFCPICQQEHDHDTHR